MTETNAAFARKQLKTPRTTSFANGGLAPQ